MKSLTLLAPCKINLTLGIRGTLPSGYHHMEMVMQTVSLCDTVTVTLTDRPGVVCRCSDPALPTDERNIACRAALAFQKAAGVPSGVSLTVEKRIPSQAGLGGGSADGGAALLALNQLLGEPLPWEELLRLGLSVGADLPFCMEGGTALVTGVGEVARALPPLPDCAILLVKPAEGVSTAACFAAYDRLPAPPAGDTTALLRALDRGKLDEVGAALFNELKLAAGLPQVAHLEEELLGLGAAGACMSGSGSAVAALFPRPEDARPALAWAEEQGLWAALCAPWRGGPRPPEGAFQSWECADS